MGDDGNAVELCAVNHGNGHEAALGEHHLGLQLADDRLCLKNALDHAEGIGEILQIKVAAQLAHRHGVELNFRKLSNQILLDAVGCADIMHFPAVLQKTRDQRHIGRDMSGRAAARQNNSLHKTNDPFSLMNTTDYYSTVPAKSF